MNRIEWLREQYENVLADHVLGDRNVRARNFDSAFDHFIGFDPTRAKKYAAWIIKTYLSRGFRFEDLSRVRDTLESFEKTKMRLPVEMRDVGRFRDLAALWGVIKPLVIEAEDLSPTGKALKRQRRDDAYRDSILLVERDDLTVAIPLTESASKWWGLGTRWCTAANKDNAFEDYNEDGPLIVIDLKFVGKFQLFAAFDEFQLMDEDDRSADLGVIRRHFAAFGPLLKWALNQNADAIKSVPDEHIDESMVLRAVAEDGSLLERVPERFCTEDVCRIAIFEQ